MAIYRHKNLIGLVEIPLEVRLSNQITIVGTDEVLSVSKGIFFLELLVLATGDTVAIKDGEGNTIATGLTGFEQDFSPLRCDYGIEFVGDIEFAKGFVLEGIFA